MAADRVISNSLGIYQLHELLRSKPVNSGIEDYIEVEAAVTGETEKRLLPTFQL